jgi:hypothetical protein
LTAPVDVIVVPTDQVAASCTVRRCSLPSMLARAGRPAARSAGVERVSVESETASAEKNSTAMAAKSATPWRGLPTMRPKRNGSENAISSSDQSSSAFVNGVPLSKG